VRAGVRVGVLDDVRHGLHVKALSPRPDHDVEDLAERRDTTWISTAK
jgi:hypothetical protein